MEERKVDLKKRSLIIVALLLAVAVILTVAGILVQKRMSTPSVTPIAGMIHLYVDGVFTANIAPTDLQQLPGASFTDTEEGKPQEGWWLRDIIGLYVDSERLSSKSQVVVEGMRQGTEAKSATLTWAEIQDPANSVLFDLAGDGQAVKLAGTLERLDTRDEWVQGVSRIEIGTKP